jgi:hypothetical protein
MDCALDAAYGAFLLVVGAAIHEQCKVERRVRAAGGGFAVERKVKEESSRDPAGRKARLERSQERRQSSSFTRFVAFATKFPIPITRLLA